MRQDDKSSMDHCRKCLTMMRMAGLKGPPMSEDDVKDQTELYARRLCRYSPAAVRDACREWAETQEKWPALAALLKKTDDCETVLMRQAELAISGPGGEGWPNRMERLLGRDLLRINASNVSAVMGLRNDAADMSDAEVERELRWAIEHGYRWRPEPAKLDAAAIKRITATMMRVRKAPGLFGGGAAAEALCSMGEAAIAGSSV